MTGRPAETLLYPAVKRFLEAEGFAVKGEVCGCDAVAVRGTELVVAELKTGLSFELVLQAVERTRLADAVWLAVPATRRGRDRDPRAVRLCRMLGLGLLAVAARGVEVLADPAPYRPRRDARRRRLVLREFDARRGDPTPGGAARAPVMTAYRQQALACAAALRAGPRRPRDLGVRAAGRILLRNVYGWFERVERGVYRLAPTGVAALERWPAPAAVAPPQRASPDHPRSRA